jgi:hypothetical protein
LFAKPEFWEAVKELQEGKGKKFSTIQKLIDDLDA